MAVTTGGVLASFTVIVRVSLSLRPRLSVTSTVTYLAADFDTDDDVDGADLTIWELAMGATDLGDADNDGDSDGNDFLAWQRQYTGPLGGISPSTTSVPEPTTALLLLTGMLNLGFPPLWRPDPRLHQPY